MGEIGVRNYPLPNNYIQEEDFKYLPAYLRGFDHYFYANFDEPLTDTDTDDWVLGLYSCSVEGEVQSFDELEYDDLGGGEFRFRKTFCIDEALSGVHYFVVYNAITEDVKFQSNSFLVIAKEDIEQYTLVAYRNSTDFDDNNYTDYSDYQSIFLHINQIGDEWLTEKDEYTAASTGKIRTRQITRQKKITLETYLFDGLADDAMASLSGHDDILINKEQMTVAEEHQSEDDKTFVLHKGAISFFIDKYASRNLKGK
jgi:hypothetical protein